MTAPSLDGYVYLAHLESRLNPDHPARHYCGHAYHLPSRIAQHLSGRGARFLSVANERGIRWLLVAIWPGTRRDERAFKRRKNAPRYCPVCNGTRMYLPDDWDNGLL